MNLQKCKILNKLIKISLNVNCLKKDEEIYGIPKSEGQEQDKSFPNKVKKYLLKA